MAGLQCLKSLELCCLALIENLPWKWTAGMGGKQNLAKITQRNLENNDRPVSGLLKIYQANKLHTHNSQFNTNFNLSL
jgi:hypothetical protein